MFLSTVTTVTTVTVVTDDTYLSNVRSYFSTTVAGKSRHVCSSLFVRYCLTTDYPTWRDDHGLTNDRAMVKN